MGIAEGMVPDLIALAESRVAGQVLMDDGPGVTLQVGIIGDEYVLGLRIFNLDLLDYLISGEDVCQYGVSHCHSFLFCLSHSRCASLSLRLHEPLAKCTNI